MIKNKVTKNDCRSLLVPKYLSNEQFENVGNFHKLKKILFSHEHDPEFQSHVQTLCPHLIDENENLHNLKNKPVETETTKQFADFYFNKQQIPITSPKRKRKNTIKKKKTEQKQSNGEKIEKIIQKMKKTMTKKAYSNEKETEISSNRSSKSNDYICSPKTKTEDSDDSTDINNLIVDEISSLESSDENGGFINIRKRSRKNDYKNKKEKEKKRVRDNKKRSTKKGKKPKKIQEEKNSPYNFEDMDIKTEEVQETGSFTESLQTTSDSEEDNIEIIDEYVSEKQVLEQIEKIVNQNINSSQQLLLIIHQWYQQKQQSQRVNNRIYPYMPRQKPTR
ncbi:hypothetical protein M0812_17339 [Anaeramoeba flamelloides]|uniref:Uncharacterized protein n=1 Tax=Anaeramoeba flamelloides TaxID=1746091 RepID=A0AAV7ZEH8_9EUKA|nr:hypothetical protein M0812_17339 [Anaeramoeba flamelloides]